MVYIEDMRGLRFLFISMLEENWSLKDTMAAM